MKKLLQETKQTDHFYLEKRNIPAEYDPLSTYDFPAWERYFNGSIRSRYETLHEDLLYTNEKQDFYRAIEAFRKISRIFKEIGE